jgi:RNA polymerase sigma factor (sigma-70 family)
VLTASQQATIESLKRYIEYIADTFSQGHDRDDWRSVAYVAACEAMVKHNPERGPARQWIARCVRQNLQKYRIRSCRRVLFRYNPSTDTDQYSRPCKASLRRFSDELVEPSAPREPRLYDAIDRLAEPHRALIRAHYVERRTIKQLCETHSCSVRRITARLSRAVAALRTTLDDMA